MPSVMICLHFIRCTCICYTLKHVTTKAMQAYDYL